MNQMGGNMNNMGGNMNNMGGNMNNNGYNMNNNGGNIGMNNMGMNNMGMNNNGGNMGMNNWNHGQGMGHMGDMMQLNNGISHWVSGPNQQNYGQGNSPNQHFNSGQDFTPLHQGLKNFVSNPNQNQNQMQGNWNNGNGQQRWGN